MRLMRKIEVKEGSRLGWTFEGDSDPISHTLELNYPLYFRRLPNGDFPEVGSTYKFDNLTYPARHSIQVGILTG